MKLLMSQNPKEEKDVSMELEEKEDMYLILLEISQSPPRRVILFHLEDAVRIMQLKKVVKWW